MFAELLYLIVVFVQTDCFWVAVYWALLFEERTKNHRNKATPLNGQKKKKENNSETVVCQANLAKPGPLLKTHT